MRIKVTDGDLIIVNMGGNPNMEQIENTKKGIGTWLSKRALHNVDVAIFAHPESVNANNCITVLSVNDLFEDTVLKDGS